MLNFFELQKRFELYVNTLPVLGLKSPKYYLNLIKFNLIPELGKEN